MTRMRLVFMCLSETDLDCCVGVGTGPHLAIKGVGRVRFQLYLGGFLEVVKVLYIPKLTINFLSPSALDEKVFGVIFYGGHVLYILRKKIQTLLGVGCERLYRFLSRPMLGSNGFLDSYFVSKSGQVAHERELIPGTQSSSRTLRGLSRHDWRKVDAHESA
jgi:hypothetical protein